MQIIVFTVFLIHPVEGGNLIEGGGLFNFPSQSKIKPKPNTDCINRVSINGVVVYRHYNMSLLNQTIFYGFRIGNWNHTGIIVM